MKNDNQEALEKTLGEQKTEPDGDRTKLDYKSVRAGTTEMRKWRLFPHAYPQVEKLT